MSNVFESKTDVPDLLELKINELESFANTGIVDPLSTDNIIELLALIKRCNKAYQASIEAIQKEWGKESAILVLKRKRLKKAEDNFAIQAKRLRKITGFTSNKVNALLVEKLKIFD